MEIQSGCEYRVSDTDYILGGESDLSVQLELRKKLDDTIFEYNQYEVANNSCTIHGSLGAVSDLMNYQYTLEERKVLWEQAMTLGADPAWGWYFNSAVNLIRNDWNTKNPLKQIASFRIDGSSKEFEKALDMGYSIVGGYKGNSFYDKDASDGVVDGTYFPNSTYGHCIRIRKTEDGDFVVDNYKGKKAYNIYKLADINALIKNGTFFKDFYLFITKNIMDKIFIDIDETSPYYNSAKLLKELEILKGYNDGSAKPEQNITRGEMFLFLERLYNSLKK